MVDSTGKTHCLRGLLDPGSQSNFLSERCRQYLNLQQHKTTTQVFGLNETSSIVSSSLSGKIRPHFKNDPEIPLDMLVVPKICSPLPIVQLPVQNWTHLHGVTLADPSFHKPGRVDFLLGVDIFTNILLLGRKGGDSNVPTALETKFGWIVLGKVDLPSPIRSFVHSFNVVSDSLLESTLRKFWELEEVPREVPQSPEDELCEQIFLNNYSRDQSGRFTVVLPFKGPEPIFDNSRSVALRRLFALERRLARDPNLQQGYNEFMKDYLDSGHMEVVAPLVNQAPSKVYYIPHHCVLRPESASTKLRVVFDASATTPSGHSLNSSLLIGAKLQKNVVDLLMDFRTHPIVVTADIKQMYRQIEVAAHHRNYQRILYRFSPTEPVQEFRLKTVTYGVSASPFLALRTLQQLATLEQQNFPRASKALTCQTYVDDIVAGCNSIEEARQLKRELEELLRLGGFKLHKWCSNAREVLTSAAETDDQNRAITFDKDTFLKILGLGWQPTQDSFSYSVNVVNRPCTKRSILSELGRTFDPVGFLSPLTFLGKCMIQKLWTLGLQWDDEPPSEIVEQWNKYLCELPSLSKLRIPRRVVPDDVVSVQLHGFCDSSEAGFGAVIYFRFVLVNEAVVVKLICAKSKVAPLKKISLPRLELCGAVLLANLINYVVESYRSKVKIDQIFAWCDSTIALAWIKSSPHRWKTFVANRVTQVQELVPPSCWFHVRSADNPADHASRGLFPEELLNNSQWWAGPSFLKSSENSWSTVCHSVGTSNSESISIEERKTTLVSVTSCDRLDELLTRHSSLNKIQRIVAYVHRFIYNARNSKNPKRGHLVEQELKQALLSLVKRVQSKTFLTEIRLLKDKKLLPKPLRKLNPFIDDCGLLRVGGRLVNSKLDFGKKHPLLLSRQHIFTELLIDQFHRRYLHVGLQTLQALLVQQFWILSAKRAIRQRLGQCFRCFRANPSAYTPIMGNLPASRVTQLKPFLHSGVDFAGPVLITSGKHRGTKTTKAYICLFVCFAVKAVHLELVSDLSAEAFIAAFRRFVARRGRCEHLYSDCGTNFVGANKILIEYTRQAAETMAINWKFNPPSAPHFGGLWERNIRSVKEHIVRVVGDQKLTYEEFYTLLTQIEAIVNSRPLTPVSSDPNDLNVLTPGHFLLMEPPSSVAEEDLGTLKLNRLNRWQLIQRCHQDFWKRWHREYLYTLQQRAKWDCTSSPVLTNSIVLVKQENTPPLQWRLGRIEKLHPGQDGISRVATVRTVKGLIQRPIAKLCPLPMQEHL